MNNLKTIILKVNHVMKVEEKDKLEKEYSEKLKVNVVILDGRFESVIEL